MAGETVGGERARTGGAGVAAGKAVAREGILVPAVVALTSIVSRQNTVRFAGCALVGSVALCASRAVRAALSTSTSSVVISVVAIAVVGGERGVGDTSEAAVLKSRVASCTC